MANHSSLIALKSGELVALIKNKLISSLFDYNNTKLKTFGKSTFNEIEKDFILNSINKLCCQATQASSSISLSKCSLSFKDESLQLHKLSRKRKNNSSMNDYLCQATLNNHNIIQTTTSQDMYLNKNDERNTLSDISINSSKTDCEEARQKNKIKIFPLESSDVYEILRRYISDDNNFQGLKQLPVDDDHWDSFIKEKLAKCLNERNSNMVKYPYMRRRVCCKLFIVFEILLRNLSIDQEVTKSLSIFLESKARREDPEMGKRYRNCISEIFTKIKEKLMLSNLGE